MPHNLPYETELITQELLQHKNVARISDDRSNNESILVCRKQRNDDVSLGQPHKMF
jgi:hypothetical protein